MTTKNESKEKQPYSKELYFVEMTVWGEWGSGHGSTVRVLCHDIETASLVAQGLKKIIPNSLSVSCGNEKLARKFVIGINPALEHNITDFVEQERW